MKEKIEGIVLEVKDEIAKVKISRHSECSNCGACPGDNAMILNASDPIGTKVGQHVEIEPKETNMIKAAFVVYVLPLIAVSGGIYLGYYVSSVLNISRILPMIIGGLVLGLLAILAIKRLDLALVDEMPTIIKVIK
jgi:sigma-E factor negative regulatory protein RseC